MKLKKILLNIFVLTAVIISGIIPSSADSDALSPTQDYELTYIVTEDNYVIITGFSGTVTNLYIPAEIDGLPVKRIENHAFDAINSAISTILSLEIENGVEEIGAAAFENCDKLTTVSLPESITLIEVDAFMDCINLKKIIVYGKDTEYFPPPYSHTGYQFGYTFEIDEEEGESVFNLISDVVLYGYNDSTTMDYAEMYGITFIPLDYSLKGDVSGDGEIGITDLIMLKKYLIKDYALMEDQAVPADLNSDGKINAFDVSALKKVLLG